MGIRYGALLCKEMISENGQVKLILPLLEHFCPLWISLKLTVIAFTTQYILSWGVVA